MKCIVLKFGGSSVANAERVRHVAQTVKSHVDDGYSVAVVVSAQGKTTDGLIAKAKELSASPDKSKLDMLLSCGETESAALLSIMLEESGVRSKAFSGWQSGILTDSAFGDSRVILVDPKNIRKAFKEGCVAVVAGFQGADENGEVTTLGRGGSDTTAVWLAHALAAEKCLIYTDVKGVYTADPKLVPHARLLAEVAMEDMHLLSLSGAKVMHSKSIDAALKLRVPITVMSSFEEGDSTELVLNRAEVKRRGFTSVAAKRGLTMYVVNAETPQNLHSLLSALRQNQIEYDVASLEPSIGRMNLSMKTTDADIFSKLLNEETTVLAESKVATISAIGRDNSQPTLAEDLFSTLLSEQVEIQSYKTEYAAIYATVSEHDLDKALLLVHKSLF